VSNDFPVIIRNGQAIANKRLENELTLKQKRQNPREQTDMFRTCKKCNQINKEIEQRAPRPL
jgi:hypothetical protein